VATLAQVLAGGTYTLAVRALVLASDLETVLHEVPGHLLDGSVDMDRKREIRRQASITLEDAGLIYRPRTPTSWTWPNHIWRIERGAIVNGQPQYQPLITGLVVQPQEATPDRAVTVQLVSRLAAADQQFAEPVVLTSGMRLNDVVLTVGALAGLGVDPALYVLEDGGAVMLETRVFDVGDNMLESLVRLCFDQGLSLADDALGHTTLAPFVDPSTVAPVATFSDITASGLLSLTRTLEQRPVYNRANVVGIAPDAYPIEAEARDLNPDSPTYNPVDGSGPIGDRPRPRYVSTDIHDQATANTVALRLLYEGALYEEAIAANAQPLPGTEDRQVVAFVGAGAMDNYLLDSVRLPLKDGAMGMATRKIRSLLAP